MENGLYLYPRLQGRHEVARVITDAAGAFELVLPSYFGKLHPECFLLASKDGYGTVSVDYTGLFTGRPIEIMLAGEDNLVGNIIDEFGAPVVGARVCLVYVMFEVAHTYSDDQGAFAIGGVVHGSLKGIYTSRSPCDLGVWAEPAERGVATRIILPRGYSKTIHVIDAGNRPLRNERVSIRSAHGHELRWTDMLTDCDGTVVVEGVTAEPLEVSCGDSTTQADAGFESVVVIPSVCQIPLEVLDDNTGIGLFDVVVYSGALPGICFFFGRDAWCSGNSATFLVGHWSLCFMADGYNPWCGVIPINGGTSMVRVRLNKRG